jgi:HEAT repeat protein
LPSLRQLRRDLVCHSPEVASAAARHLAAQPDPRALTPLLEALARPYLPHATIADALVVLGSTAAPALVAALARDRVPQPAVEVLARIGPAAQPSIAAGAASGNAQIRRYCTLLLEDDDRLRAALADPECGVRWAASTTLVRRGVRFTAAELLSAAESCRHGYSHVDVGALAPHVNVADVRVLLRRLAPVPKVGTAAIRLLLVAGERDFVRDLLAGDDPIAVGQAAHVAYYAGDLNLQRVAATRVLGRASPEIRAAAASAIGSALAREYAGALAAIVENETDDPGVRANCLWQLKPAELPRAVLSGLCEQAYESPDRRLRHTAVNVMPPGARLDAILQRAIGDPDWNVSYAAGSRLNQASPPTPR